MGVKCTGASNQYAEIDSTAITSALFAASIWFNSVSTSVNDTLWSIVDKGETNVYYSVRADNAGKVLVLKRSGDEETAATTTSYSAGVWHHAFLNVASATDAKIYLDNGGEATETTDVDPQNLDRTAIGGLRDASPGDYADAKLAEFGLWPGITLTADERAALAAGYSPLFIRPAILAGGDYWSLKDINYVDETGARTFVGANDSGSGAPTNAQDHPPIIYPTGQQLFHIAEAAGVSVAVLRRRYEGY